MGNGHPKSTGAREQTRPTRLNQQKKLGGKAANNKDLDPTQGADTIISYIRDSNLGKATAAIMSHGVAPANEDTIKQVIELLTPAAPRPTWTDTRPNPTSRARVPAQIDIPKLGGALRATPKKNRRGHLRMELRAPPNPYWGKRGHRSDRKVHEPHAGRTPPPNYLGGHEHGKGYPPCLSARKAR